MNQATTGGIFHLPQPEISACSRCREVPYASGGTSTSKIRITISEAVDGQNNRKLDQVVDQANIYRLIMSGFVLLCSKASTGRRPFLWRLLLGGGPNGNIVSLRNTHLHVKSACYCNNT